MGEERLVYFQPSHNQVFAQRLMTGGRFWLGVQARRSQDEERVHAARLSVSDETRARVYAMADHGSPAAGGRTNPADGGPSGGQDAGPEGEPLPADAGDAEPDVQAWGALQPPLPNGVVYPFWVEILAPGEVTLSLEDESGVLDHISLTAAHARQLHLLEVNLLGSDLDARLPARFGLTSEAAPREVGIAAEDRCGGALLALDAIALASSDEEVCTVVRQSALTFGLTPLAAGSTELHWMPRGPVALDVVEPAYGLSVVGEEDIDRVRLDVAKVEDNTALVWARGFAADVEVVDVEYRWEASERVELDRTRGPWVYASISFPAEDEAPDDRPAEVSARWQENEKEIDLLQVRENEINRTRIAPASPAFTNTSVSCLGETCDPMGASLLGGWFCARRFRRKRRQTASR